MVYVENIVHADSWRLTGMPESVEVTYVVEHPQITRPDGTRLTSFEEPYSMRTTDGVLESTDCYFFDEDYELVPGTWRLSVVLDGSTIATRAYTVVPPE